MIRRAGAGVVPGRVRQQEVDARRGEAGQRVVYGHRVVQHVDGAEQTEVEVGVPVLAEQFDGPEHQRMAGAAVGEAAVPVVGRAVPVEGDADPDVELVEQVEVPGAELEAVGMDPEVELGGPLQGPGELLTDAAQPCGPCQQWLPSVQDH